MSQLQTDHEQRQEPFGDYRLEWCGYCGYNLHCQSPVQDYNSFNSFVALPTKPTHQIDMYSPHEAHLAQNTTYSQLPPLIMPQVPQWPSMLMSQSTYQDPLFPPALQPITLASATPISASSTHSRTPSTPRKTLTDSDRRRICQYHEDNPTIKQTEIGAMFGVERSTVSKILRQKEKYLYQDDGSRSPIKGSKGKFPDIERALSNWARNHQRQGLPLSDATILDKAHFFAQAVGSADSHLEANSSSWLEKFKQKNHLTGARSRKGSVAEEPEETSNLPSRAHTPRAIPATSPGGVSPGTTTIKTKGSEEKLKTEGPLPDTSQIDNKGLSAHSSLITPSQEEAARALELVMNFFQSQNAGLVVEPQEYVTIGKLMEKLRPKRSAVSIPSNMRCVSKPN